MLVMAGPVGIHRAPPESSLHAYPPTAYSRFPTAATPTRALRVDMEATTCQRSVRVS